MKKLVFFSLLLLFTGLLPLKAQFEESPERKEMWRRSKRKHKAREAFNPYLDKKKTKPSRSLARENAREQKRQLKAAKKQKKRSMKKLGYKETKVKRAK
ncbi:MAG: hypothetical protein K0R26_1875 [Bacteroidota bacterium]|jgi:hypothetical protein|nr:hypothetical protein [Bacteroidota bacterium]